MDTTCTHNHDLVLGEPHPVSGVRAWICPDEASHRACIFCGENPQMGWGQHPTYCRRCAGWKPSKAMCDAARP